MRDLLMALARGPLRLVAVLWLCVAAPLDLAVALVALIGGPTVLGVAGSGLVAARIAVVAMGLVLGRLLHQRADALPLALVWAAADLGTLAVVFATRLLPSSRAPGDAPLVWGGYALAAAAVVGASLWTRPAGRGSDAAD